MRRTIHPPFNERVNYQDYQYDPTRITLKSIETAGGSYQETYELPVGVYQPLIRRRPIGTVAVRGFAWSASNTPAYQQARNQIYADVLGMTLISPNTPGQGEGTLPMTIEHRKSLERGGRARAIGKTMMEAALMSLEVPISSIDELILIGDSQHPSFQAAMMEALPEHIALNQVLMFTPAGACERRLPAPALPKKFNDLQATIILGWQMNTNGRTAFELYRSRNPASCAQLEDTDLFANLRTQHADHLRAAHFLAKGTLANDVLQAMRFRDVHPEITIFSAEHDRVSSLEAARDVSHAWNARWDVMRGHYHAVTEDVQLIAQKLRTILS